jgi:hypothetical protein
MALQCLESIYDNLDNTTNYLHPLCFMLSLTNTDTLTFSQAMREDDAIEFLRAADAEVRDHEQRGHWERVLRSSMPTNHKAIPAVWAMKRKSRPDGTLLKHKARLCAGGHRQIYEVNYWDTYSPVVQWATVRLLLVLAALEGLHTRQVDFVLAFPQADLDVLIYMQLPQGFDEDSQKYVLLLKKNLYGLKQASSSWFDKLRGGLLDRGFRQSTVDPCCFLKSDFVFLVFVDDCLLFSRSSASLLALITDLQREFILTDDGAITAVSDYLGIRITKHGNGSISLTQPAIIQRVLDLLCITPDSKTHATPVITKGLLHSDLDGPPRKQQWHYRAAIGMLNYISSSTRPDIAFATHQCARFCNNPMLSHEQAVKRICRYLAGTKDKGILFTPDPTQSLHCYVDADFAGLWNVGDSQDPISVMSRTGFVICYGGCPILWLSKLQTEVALSTTEAEYIALSQSLRDAIPLLGLLAELRDIFVFATHPPLLSCTLFEDNKGALALATDHKARPRTKHIGLKYHHFRSHVLSGLVKILPISTFEQTADIFTKPLPAVTFRYLRAKLIGW